tara:strand:- start:2155 stop:2271 length:117 start_codon:yes stop_codon:yes gene_type:complete
MARFGEIKELGNGREILRYELDGCLEIKYVCIRGIGSA